MGGHLFGLLVKTLGVTSKVTSACFGKSNTSKDTNTFVFISTLLVIMKITEIDTSLYVVI